jgi:hypothetical protein
MMCVLVKNPCIAIKENRAVLPANLVQFLLVHFRTLSWLQAENSICNQ